MKKTLYFILITVLVVVVLIFSATFSLDRQKEERLQDVKRADASLDLSRHKNGRLIPVLSGEISDVRIQIIDRKYENPSFMEDFRNLQMMQILYGFYSDGQWHDYPSENYPLIGILNNQDRTDWEIALGSHMVKIGPYLLISISSRYTPDALCRISDSLGSEFEEPFAQYYTYQKYVDAAGNSHAYSDDHSTGYGYLAENPDSDAEMKHNMMAEFPRRYYLVLDYATLPDDYEVTLSLSNGNGEKHYLLTADMIHNALNLE